MIPMTFNELCQNVTQAEREALAWHLGMLRLRETVRVLSRPPDDGSSLASDDALRQLEIMQFGAPLSEDPHHG